MSKQHKVCALSDLKKCLCTGFSIGDLEGFVLIIEDEIRAYVNSCPHIGMNLEFVPNRFLDSDNRYIQCSMHGALFEKSTGKCIHGPCLGESLAPLEAAIYGDDVLITLE